VLFCGYSISIDLVSTQKPEEPNLFLPQIKEGMRLWTPQGLGDEVSLEETSENLIICGQVLTDFLSLKINPTDYLDIVESCGVNIDEYL